MEDADESRSRGVQKILAQRCGMFRRRSATCQQLLLSTLRRCRVHEIVRLHRPHPLAVARAEECDNAQAAQWAYQGKRHRAGRARSMVAKCNAPAISASGTSVAKGPRVLCRRLPLGGS